MAFQTARSRRPELDDAWVALSLKLVAKIPSASFNIQRTGSFDLVVRWMADELADDGEHMPYYLLHDSPGDARDRMG